LLTTCDLLPVTDVKRSALEGLLSTMRGIRSPEQVLAGDAGPGLDLLLVVQESEAELTVRGGEHDLLRIGLIHGESE
jgi:hypothetical protein